MKDKKINIILDKHNSCHKTCPQRVCWSKTRDRKSLCAEFSRPWFIKQTPWCITHADFYAFKKISLSELDVKSASQSLLDFSQYPSSKCKGNMLLCINRQNIWCGKNRAVQVQNTLQQMSLMWQSRRGLEQGNVKENPNRKHVSPAHAARHAMQRPDQSFPLPPKMNKKVQHEQLVQNIIIKQQQQ